MIEPLRQFARSSSEFLVREHGFKRRGATLLREDSLVRKVHYLGMSSDGEGSQNFDILLDLGLPGLAIPAVLKDPWTFRASASRIRRFRHPEAPSLTFWTSPEDQQVAEWAERILHTLCHEYLFAIEGPDDLVDLARNDSAEYRRLHLDPENDLARLERAGVFLAHLGRRVEAEQVAEEASAHASAHDLETNLPDVLRNIRTAIAGSPRGTGRR